MKNWLFAISLMPYIAISQQIVELCGNTQTFTYTTQSDPIGSIEWQVKDVLYYGNAVTVTWDQPGTYQIIATPTSNNCAGEPQTYTVIVQRCVANDIWVPNTFTPNTDEFNSTWSVTVNPDIMITNFNLLLVNRWGNVIWQSFNPAAEWDGTYQTNKVPDGIYFWMISYINQTDTTQHKIHGHVTILR